MELYVLSHHLHLIVLIFPLEVHSSMSSVKVNCYDLFFSILISFVLHICIFVKFHYNYFLYSGNFSPHQPHIVAGGSNLTGNLRVNFAYRESQVTIEMVRVLALNMVKKIPRKIV